MSIREEIIYKLPYRIKGEDSVINIKIDFISNRIMNEYAESQYLASVALSANNRMAVLFELIAIAKETKEDGWKDKVKAYEDEYLECSEKILEFNDNGFFNMRFDLLKKILSDNKYEDNELLNSKVFWNENVEPHYFASFLEAAVRKDMPKKKARAV